MQKHCSQNLTNSDGYFNQKHHHFTAHCLLLASCPSSLHRAVGQAVEGEMQKKHSLTHQLSHVHNHCLISKRPSNSSTFWEMCSFALLLRVRWELLWVKTFAHPGLESDEFENHFHSEDSREEHIENVHDVVKECWLSVVLQRGKQEGQLKNTEENRAAVDLNHLRKNKVLSQKDTTNNTISPKNDK